MGKHTHGGNIYQYKNCLDFSANCNPLGTPESVIQAGMESMRKVAHYPCVGYGPLREAIAAYEDVQPEQIICGNGAAEVIFTLCHALAPKKALLPAPTFAEYEQALKSFGTGDEECQIQYYYLEESHGFYIQENLLNQLDDSLDIVFLCNPNNPTGVLTEKEFLLRILEKCRERKIFLVIDECFQDFIEFPENYSLKNEISSYQNLFLLKAFTKRYAMAGVRLGYGICGNHTLLERMEQCVQPWNLSIIAQECGIAALREEEYVETTRDLIFKEKIYLRKEMEALGMKVYDSMANYFFFKAGENLFEQCLKKNILIRDCSNYEGLGKGFYRIAVKLHEENERLIQALREIQSEE